MIYEIGKWIIAAGGGYILYSYDRFELFILILLLYVIIEIQDRNQN